MKIVNQISRVSFIGSGNVATALGLAFNIAGIKVDEVYSPNENNAKSLANKLKCGWVKNIEDLNTNSDLYIIAIPDQKIIDIKKYLPKINGIFAHTSGSQSIDVLNINRNKYGVFYPLQTFSKSREVEFTNIPVCIEGSDETTTNLLIDLAKKISNNVVMLNSEQRQYLHLTAVTVNNFSNLMYNLAHDVLIEKEIDFSLLLPLIQETALKVHIINPSEAQTGPARRNDKSTINKHLELLNNYPDYKEVYRLLSNQLIRKYHDKL